MLARMPLAAALAIAATGCDAPAPEWLAPLPSRAVALAVDDRHAYVLGDQLVRIPRDGGDAEMFALRLAGGVVAGDLLEVFTTAEYVVWREPGGLARVGRDGGAVEVAGLPVSWLGTDGTDVFFTFQPDGATQELWSWPAGADPVLIQVRASGDGFGAAVVDEAGLCWADGVTIWCLDRPGWTERIVATADVNFVAAMDAERIYWLDSGSGTTELWAADRNSGEVVLLGEGPLLSNLGHAVVDADGVYTGHLRWRDGVAEVLLPTDEVGNSPVGEVALADGYLYWLADAGLFRYPTDGAPLPRQGGERDGLTPPFL